MLPAIRVPLVVALACLPGCPAPWDPPIACSDLDACTPDASSSGDESTTSAHEPTTTGDPSSTTSDPDLTTGTPTDEPTILEYELVPNPAGINGPIVVTVTTAHTTEVRMSTGLGQEEIVLTPQQQPGVFTGQIPVLTGLLNGLHEALLTPWQANTNGDPERAHYEIALPTPGSERLWETGDLIGAGQVVAMATLPGGELVELGNHSPDGEPNCYLRKRDKTGQWALADIIDVLPGTPCLAVDLKIDHDSGALFVVVHQQGVDGLRWRLMQLPAWGESAKHMGLGAKNEKAVALARHESGTLAVCGTAPTGEGDQVDAMAQIFKPGAPSESWVHDYQPSPKSQHFYAERTQDCVFVGDTLALVGAANGQYDMELTLRDRLFILRLDIGAKTSAWTVPPPGGKVQSGAQAVDVDDLGRLVIAAFTCDDDCQPEADLRIYDAADTLKWKASLGTFPTKQFAVQDLAWSPAKYAVVATGGLKGQESAFTVRAFSTDQEEALWTFTREDLQMLHFALALAIGEYGEVYAGGSGANGFPAIAFIAG